MLSRSVLIPPRPHPLLLCLSGRRGCHASIPKLPEVWVLECLMSLFIRGTTIVQNTANKGPLFKEPKWVAAAGGEAQGPTQTSVCFGGPGQARRGRQSLCSPLVSQPEKAMAPHSSALAWKILPGPAICLRPLPLTSPFLYQAIRFFFFPASSPLGYKHAITPPRLKGQNPLNLTFTSMY